MSDLPPGWEWATLDDIGDYVNGRGFKRSEWSSEGRPIVRIQNLTGTSAQFNHFAGKVDERHIARDGDLLISWAATLGSYIWHGPEAAINQHIFKVKSSIDIRFHRYLIDHLIGQLQSRSHGSGIVHVTRQKFGTLRFKLPPLAEQKRIVAVLEDHLSRLDAADRSLRASIARLAVLRRSILLEKFDIESSAVGLNVRRLGEVVQLASGQTPRGLADLPIDSSEGAIPFYKVGDMNLGDGRHMSLSRLSFSTETLTRAGVHVRPRGTVLIPKRGGAIATNKKRILSIAAAYDLNTMGLVPSEVVDPCYLWYWLESVDLAKLADGSNVPQINNPDLAPLLIPVPPRKQQAKLVAELDEQIGRIDRDRWDAVVRRSENLRQSVLAEAFSGRLVSQDPCDEPASVLLERIRAGRAAMPKVRRGRRDKNTGQETLL